MRSKRIFVLLGLVVLLVYSLCGCQLAAADGMETQNDRLIGVFITPEHLDLFDMEGYLNDHISSFPKNGEMIIAGNEEKYNGRIYAVLKSRTLTNEETGEETEIWEYEFEGMAGVPFFLVRIAQPDGESYIGTISDNRINDAHVSIGEETTLEGTLYITPDGTKAMYPNPVYQSGDGRVYLTAGTGISFSGDMGEGAAFSQTLEEKHTVTENGTKTEERFKVTVKAAIKYPPLSIRILQMNAENVPVSQADYRANTLPSGITVGEDTAYVITETKVASPDGETIVRELFTPEDKDFTFYTVRDDGICEGKTTALLWQESRK